ncbi:MAG TPA: hypothetical protein VN880_21075 [Solirubrobacteraceae bacterium]|nr:hypothetical protein [Solirubrobacteraceae bacterium]
MTTPPSPSASEEQPGQATVQSSPNIRWYISSRERPSNSSGNDFDPSSVTNVYCFSTGTHGSSRGRAKTNGGHERMAFVGARVTRRYRKLAFSTTRRP